MPGSVQGPGSMEVPCSAGMPGSVHRPGSVEVPGSAGMPGSGQEHGPAGMLSPAEVGRSAAMVDKLRCLVQPQVPSSAELLGSAGTREQRTVTGRFRGRCAASGRAQVVVGSGRNGPSSCAALSAARSGTAGPLQPPPGLSGRGSADPDLVTRRSDPTR